MLVVPPLQTRGSRLRCADPGTELVDKCSGVLVTARMRCSRVRAVRSPKSKWRRAKAPASELPFVYDEPLLLLQHGGI